jgi:hypothetical protein
MVQANPSMRRWTAVIAVHVPFVHRPSEHVESPVHGAPGASRAAQSCVPSQYESSAHALRQGSPIFEGS